MVRFVLALRNNMVNTLIETLKNNPFHAPVFKVGCDSCPSSDVKDSKAVRRFGAAAAAGNKQ